MDHEQFINQQIAERLLVYNYDLRKKKGDHYLEYFSWIVIVSAWGFIAVRIISFILRH